MKSIVKYLVVFSISFAIAGCDLNEQLYQDVPDSKVLFALDNLEREVYLAPSVEEHIFELMVYRSGVKNDKRTEVQLENDPSVLQNFNEQMNSSYQLLPEDYYSYASTVTIGQGEQIGRSDVTIYARKATEDLDGYALYAIPFKIAQASEADINEEKQTFILIVNIREPYIRQGIYGVEDAVAIGNSSYQNAFSIYVEFDNEWDIDLGYEADFSLVDVFNSNNDTDYQPLPEENIQLLPDSFTLPAGSNYISVDVELTTNGLDYFEPFLLPIRLLSKGDFPIDPDRDIIYLRFTRDFDMNDAEIVPLTVDMIETFTQESSEGPKESLVDGDTGTYWHSSWSSGVEPLPHWIQINFTEPTELGGLNYTFRQPSGITDRPNHFDIQVSDDGSTWTTVWESSAGLPVEPVDVKRTLVFDQNYTSQMFRIRILDTYGSRNWTHLSTIEVFRVKE
jgi:hypothetical protein